MVRILSIQSSVAYGHVGNSAATFPLQRLGHDVWAVLTVHFSNHTGYGAWRGTVLDPAAVRDVIEGIADRGVLDSADALLTGYQGSPGVVEVVADTLHRLRAANPHLVYCCDPVLGDVGRGFFVAPGIPELMRDLIVPKADIVTPNAFELAYLTGRDPEQPFRDVTAVLDAARELRAAGPRTVLVTSVQDPQDPEHLGMIAVSDDGAFEVRVPRLPISVNGAGDVTAALFLAHFVDAGTEVALARTASSVHAILDRTYREGSREIRLIDAQDAIAAPACEFPVRRLAASP